MADWGDFFDLMNVWREWQDLKAFGDRLMSKQNVRRSELQALSTALLQSELWVPATLLLSQLIVPLVRKAELRFGLNKPPMDVRADATHVAMHILDGEPCEQAACAERHKLFCRSYEQLGNVTWCAKSVRDLVVGPGTGDTIMSNAFQQAVLFRILAKANELGAKGWALWQCPRPKFQRENLSLSVCRCGHLFNITTAPIIAERRITCGQIRLIKFHKCKRASPAFPPMGLNPERPHHSHSGTCPFHADVALLHRAWLVVA